MRLCAFWGAEPIPLSLLMTEDGEWTDLLKRVLETDEEPDRKVSLLCRYSLMDVQQQQQTLVVHRLVQEMVRDGLAEEEGQAWAERALLLVDAAFVFDPSDVATWAPSARIVAQALAVAEHGLALYLDEGAGRLLNRVSGLLRNRGLYTQAHSARVRALAIGEQVYGPDHPEVAIRVNNLGLVLQDLGDLAGARAHFERALAIAEKAYGPDHPTVVAIRDNLNRLE